MFFTLTSLRALIIDADDFGTRPQVLTETINTLDLVIKVVLVTRRNFVSANLQSRTTCPMDILEHLDFKNLLKRAITELKVPPASTLFLCTSTNTLELAKELLLGTVVFIKQPLTDLEKHLLYQESPDFVVDSLDALFKCLSIQDSGYAGEVASAPERLIKSPYNFSSPLINPSPFIGPSPLIGSSPRTTQPKASMKTPLPPIKTKTRIVALPNLEHPDCPYYVMGRYFGSSDPRHQLHALSLRVWNFKHHHTPHAGLFADLFIRGIAAATGGAYDIVTQVPSRPEVGDRLAHILSLMQSKLPKPLLPAPRDKTIQLKQLMQPGEILPALILPEQILRTRIQPGILRCVKSYPPLKALNLQARKASIAKVFEVQKDIKNKRVVIIDDIVTTGATMNACIAELKAAGAVTVTPVLLAYHPYALKPHPAKSDHDCSECGERLGFAFEHSHIHFQCLRYTNDNHSKISFNQAVNDHLHNCL